MSQQFFDKEIEESLKKKHEGHLFVHIYLLRFGKTFSVIKDFYTIKNGEVHLIENGKEIPSKDTLFNLTTKGTYVGKYNPNKKYKRVIKDYTYSEFKKLHKL